MQARRKSKRSTSPTLLTAGIVLKTPIVPENRPWLQACMPGTIGFVTTQLVYPPPLSEVTKATVGFATREGTMVGNCSVRKSRCKICSENKSFEYADCCRNSSKPTCHTHTHTLSLSLSLSHTHTHHTCALSSGRLCWVHLGRCFNFLCSVTSAVTAFKRACSSLRQSPQSFPVLACAPL